MNLGELWWKRLVNSVRFLDAVKDALIDGKSVVMSFDNEIPWQELMLEELEQQIAFLTETHLFVTHDASEIREKPGEFLFMQYCDEYDRTHHYWPSMTHEYFLANDKNTSLKHRVVCITGVNSGNAAAWIRTVNEYISQCSSEEHGIFIIISQGAAVQASKNIETIRYSDYVSDYDCLMLCMTVLSTEKCSPVQKQYVSEVASDIARGNISIAGALASEGYKLARSPYETAVEALQEIDIKTTDLHERVRSGVWEAQIKLVFPRLEDFRRELVTKHRDELQKRLPITSSSGESVEKAADLEIGQLYFVCNQHNILEKCEFELLKKMRDARNMLAHQETLTLEQLTELKIL